MAAPTDAELLPRLLAGEQRAFRELVGAYQGAMRAVAWAIIGRSHTEEVVQDAWLAAVRGLDGFQGRSSLKTWLLTITANTAKSRLRQVRREVFLDDLPGPMVRWMTSALPPTVTGASRRTPGTRIRRKPCSPRANCAIAWTRPSTVCPSCSAAC